MAVPPAYWWSREFAGRKAQVREVRAWLEDFLPACDALDDLILIATELATHAVTHTRSGDPGGRITVDVTWSADCARVVVGDQGSDEVPDTPREQQPDEAETGRGLFLVAALSAAWGLAGNAAARWVWADVPWASRGGPVLETASGDLDPELALAELSRARPGITAWFDQQSGEWTALLPQPGAGDTVRAPSPTALIAMVAARHLAVR